MVANTGYTPSMTHFSCRVARYAKSRANQPEVDIIALLKEYAARSPGLKDAMGNDFARGHRQASGGIVPTELFEKLWNVMVDTNPGENVESEGSPRKKRKKEVSQKNTLEGWVKRG
jgi:hypothetical protein